MVQLLDEGVEELSIAFRLQAVKDTEELREAHKEMQPKVVELSLKVSQSQALYDAFVKLKETEGGSMTEAQLRTLDSVIKSAEPIPSRCAKQCACWSTRMQTLIFRPRCSC